MSACSLSIPAHATRQCSSVITGNDAEILTHIYDADTNLAIWQRNSVSGIDIFVEQLFNSGNCLSFSAVMSSSSLKASLDESLPALSHKASFISDVVELADMFECLFELNAVGLRLTLLTQAMCPRFHVDKVPCRLVTTYGGTGTEWLANESVDRSKLGTGNKGLPDERSGIYTDAGIIRRLSAGDVGLMKGESWVGNEGMGLVHRSPGLPPGEKRLLLTLDFGH